MANVTLNHEELEKFRNGFGIKTDSQLADEIGISRSYFRQIKSGARRMNLDFVAGMYMRFGVDLSSYIYNIDQDGEDLI